MYEIWELFVENYSSYRVRTKVLTDGQTDKPDSYRAPAEWRDPNYYFEGRPYKDWTKLFVNKLNIHVTTLSLSSIRSIVTVYVKV